jgi:hypothetical protein
MRKKRTASEVASARSAPNDRDRAGKSRVKARVSRAKASTNRNPLERVRAICLALPEATEKIAWGAPTFRVRDKIFAMYLANHHNDGRIALWCNAPKGLQEVLVGSEPNRFFRPPYVGTRGWIGLHLQANSDEAVAGFVREAYCMTAPNKLRTLLGE